MYTTMTKSHRKHRYNHKNFFTEIPASETGNAAAIVSHKMAKSLSEDIFEMANFMTQTIMEGLIDGRR